MHLIMCLDWVKVKQAEAIKLTKSCNTSSALVRCDSTFIDTMKVMMNYAVVFNLEHGVRFFYASKKDIVDDSLSSENLPTRTGAACVR